MGQLPLKNNKSCWKQSLQPCRWS